MMVVVAGTLMYIIEGGAHGFNSIPASIYWATVTVTTVGFGDITPYTDLGKFLATIMMILGYAVIAVPTGLITVEMAKMQIQDSLGTGHISCESCENVSIPFGSNYCNQCGEKVIDQSEKELESKID